MGLDFGFATCSLMTSADRLHHTHIPAAIHSSSSSSPCRTSMELDEPVGDNQVGAASTTLRAAGEHTALGDSQEKNEMSKCIFRDRVDRGHVMELSVSSH